MLTCRECKYWQPEPENSEYSGRGQCRRYAPRLTAEAWADWALTLPLQWCGESEPKEPTP